MFNKKIIIFLFFIFTSILTRPAHADEPFALTPSGSAEAFYDLSVVETSDLLANSCINYGWQTISTTDTVVVCEIPVSAGSRILSALAGPKYATPPREFIRFNIASSKGFSRVQTSGWREIQTAFGQNQRTDFEGDRYHNNIMRFLIGIGGIYPPGTSFPNHALILADFITEGDTSKGMEVSKVYEGGAFERAGLKEGDLVKRIAGKKIKNTNDILNGLNKATKSDTFTVQYYRQSKKYEANVPVIYRETASPLPEPKQRESEQITSTIVQKETSIADELERLAELKEKGILSEEEFSAAKQKILKSP